ncbi:hypothetical protein R1sor_025217 [Riccia sorocarpa]|uniref:Reverse transcriptase zinc-binding domain-containing protein n=1 Tax=Riccia sorocarpa TaxID=122646 RepID=A0ABD3G9Z5_9MARC
MKLVSKLMEGHELDWTQTARAIIEWKILSVKCRSEEVSDTLQEILICGRRLQLKDSPTLERMLDSWWEARRFLFFKPNAPIPQDLRIELALKLTLPVENRSQGVMKGYLHLLKRVGIGVVGDITVENLGKLADLERGQDYRQADQVAEGPVSFMFWHIQEVVKSRTLSAPKLSDGHSWEWKNGRQTLQGWSQTTQAWRSLLAKSKPEEGKLNGYWGVDWTQERWKNFWGKLWETDIFLRDKFWTWRIIQRGFLVNERLKRMMVDSGECRQCEGGQETTEHCFISCNRVNRQWTQMSTALNKALPTSLPEGNLMKWLEGILRNRRTRLAPLILFIVHTRAAWRERCKQQYKGKKELKPSKQILEDSATLTQELVAVKTSAQKRKWLEEARNYLLLAKDLVEREDWRRQADTQRLLGRKSISTESPHDRPTRQENPNWNSDTESDKDESVTSGPTEDFLVHGAVQID